MVGGLRGLGLSRVGFSLGVVVSRVCICLVFPETLKPRNPTLYTSTLNSEALNSNPVTLSLEALHPGLKPNLGHPGLPKVVTSQL